jgi:hypothetical protein
MSVTFTIEAIPTGAFAFTCFAGDSETVIPSDATTFEAALVDVSAHKLVCDECDLYGCYVETVMDVSRDFDVNVTQTNARTLAGALGLGLVGSSYDDLCGSATGEDFLGRVLIALAEDRDDSGIAWATTKGTRGATMTDCGVRPGYYADVFGRLHALAAEAVRLGRDIHWS